MISIYWLPLIGITAVLLYLGVRYLRGTPQITIVEVPKFLHNARVEEFLHDLNPLREEVLRLTFSRRSFLHSQWETLHRMKERLSCMSHNALTFIYLANTEIWRETKEHPGMENAERYIALAEELHRAAVEFRVYAIVALLKIECLLVFRTKSWLPFPAPSLAGVGRCGELQFKMAYERFKNAVAALCLEYGEEFQEEVMPLL